MMTIHEKVRDEALKYDIYRVAAKYERYYQAKLINMNILQMKKYYLLVRYTNDTNS